MVCMKDVKLCNYNVKNIVQLECTTFFIIYIYIYIYIYIFVLL